MKHLPQTRAQLFVLAAKSQPSNPKWPQSITRVTHEQHKLVRTRGLPADGLFPETLSEVSDEREKTRHGVLPWRVRPLFMASPWKCTYIFWPTQTTSASQPSLIRSQIWSQMLCSVGSSEWQWGGVSSRLCSAGRPKTPNTDKLHMHRNIKELKCKLIYLKDTC